MKVSEYNDAVEAYADRLYLFAYKRLKDHAIAQDIVQDTFTKTWLKREDIDSSKIKSYLFTACHHILIDWIRKYSRINSEAELPEEAYHNEDKDIREVINLALEQLPDIQQTVVMLRDYEGYNYQEIAEITSLSESQVKVYIFRARKKMKHFIVKLDSAV